MTDHPSPLENICTDIQEKLVSYDPKTATSVQREEMIRLYEQMTVPIKMKNPFLIKGKPSNITILPKKDFLEQLRDYENDATSKTKKQSQPLQNPSRLSGKHMRTHPTYSHLYFALRKLGYFLSGSFNANAALTYLQGKPYTPKSDANMQFQLITTALITPDFLINIAENHKDGRVELFNKLKTASTEVRQAYKNLCTSRSEKIRGTIDALINKHYAQYVPQLGTLPSLLLLIHPPSESQLAELYRARYYAGEDVSESAIGKLPQGKRIVYMTKYPNARNRKARKTRKNIRESYATKVFELIFKDIPLPNYITSKDLSTDAHSLHGTAKISELLFAFHMNILAHHDPQLTSSPFYAAFIKDMITKVYHPSSQWTMDHFLQLKDGAENIYADGRIDTANGSLLIELKANEYSQRKSIFTQLERYQRLSSWLDGTRITQRVLIIEDMPEKDTRLQRYAKSNQWTVLSGDDIRREFHAALDHYDDVIGAIHPALSDDLRSIDHHINDARHVFRRKGFRKLRSLTQELLRLCIQSFSNNVFIIQQEYQTHYQLKLSELPIAHPSEFITLLDPQTAYFDIEALGGLNDGSPITTTTIGHRVDNDFIIDVYLAPHLFSQEQGMLTVTNDQLNTFAAVVTYNGKAYDFPKLNERLFYHNILIKQPSYLHRDLYADHFRKTRKIQKHLKTSLKEIERAYLQIHRTDDVSGEECIKLSENHVLHTGDGLSQVIAHNIPDVVNLAILDSFVYKNHRPSQPYTVSVADILSHLNLEKPLVPEFTLF